MNLGDMTAGADPEQLFICPYDSTHLVRKKKLPYHIPKCRKNWAGTDFKICPFNSNHVIPAPEFAGHKAMCEDRYTIEMELENINRKKADIHQGLPVVRPVAEDKPYLPASSEDWDLEYKEDLKFREKLASNITSLRNVKLDKTPPSYCSSPLMDVTSGSQRQSQASRSRPTFSTTNTSTQGTMTATDDEFEPAKVSAFNRVRLEATTNRDPTGVRLRRLSPAGRGRGEVLHRTHSPRPFSPIRDVSSFASFGRGSSLLSDSLDTSSQYSGFGGGRRSRQDEARKAAVAAADQRKAAIANPLKLAMADSRRAAYADLSPPPGRIRIGSRERLSGQPTTKDRFQGGRPTSRERLTVGAALNESRRAAVPPFFNVGRGMASFHNF